MMIFFDIPYWMGFTLWFVVVNIGVVSIAHLWLWFFTRLETRKKNK